MKTYKEFISICEQASAYGQLRYGSTPAKATGKSVSSSVDKALSAPGTSQSASSQKGKTGVTGSLDVQYSGSRSQPKPQATSTEPARRIPKPDRTYVASTTTKGTDRDGNEVINIFNNTKKKVPFNPKGYPGVKGSAIDTTKAYGVKQLPPF